jgi:hypothetical protein
VFDMSTFASNSSDQGVVGTSRRALCLQPLGAHHHSFSYARQLQDILNFTDRRLLTWSCPRT